MKSKPKLTRFLVITVISLSTCLIFITIPRLPLQAEEPQVATNWQQASFPVENFQAYTSPYGYRISPTTGRQEFHYGLDIAAPLGSYVRSWWSGQVVELSDNTNCGTQITIQSGDWQHIYCHLNGYIVDGEQGRYLVDTEKGVQVWQGQKISTGARIARVGMTGATTGPHLHWALKYRGIFKDPADILRAMYVNHRSS